MLPMKSQNCLPLLSPHFIPVSSHLPTPPSHLLPLLPLLFHLSPSLPPRPWCESTLSEACQLLLEDLPLAPNAPGGMTEFRLSLVTSFFFKFYLTVLSRISTVPLPHELESTTLPFHRDPVQSSQGFQRIPGDQPSDDAVGRPMMQLSALKQATGEARYVCVCTHVLSLVPRPHGRPGNEANMCCVCQVCSHAKTGTFWKPFSTNFDMPIKPKLAETALLFCRVTDVPFLPKWNNEPKLAEKLVNNGTPRIHSEALFATCTLAATCGMGECIASLQSW